MRTMRMTIGCVAALCLAVVSLRADEEKIAVDKLPKAVLDAVKKRFPKAEIKEASKEEEKGKVEYEVSLKDGDTHIDATYTPEGKLTLIEKTVDVKTLPKVVTAALEEKYPKATHKSAEEVIKVTDDKETLDYYEVVVVAADKKTYEVQVLADGKIKNTEEKKEEKEEKKEEKKEKKEKK